MQKFWHFSGRVVVGQDLVKGDLVLETIIYVK